MKRLLFAGILCGALTLAAFAPSPNTAEATAARTTPAALVLEAPRPFCEDETNPFLVSQCNRCEDTPGWHWSFLQNQCHEDE